MLDANVCGFGEGFLEDDTGVMKFVSFPLHVDIWLGNTFVAER